MSFFRAFIWVLCALFLGSPLSADQAAQTTPAQVAPVSTPETLAGEDRAVPTALPTPEGDAGGPAMVSRSAQPAPSFALPAFVVTGGGERQDLVSRGDLSSGLDTSGGIKTSPGEKGAGQDQRATEAVRAAPSDETYTPTPHYGELSASYGFGETLNLNGLLAGEEGPWFGWLEGGTHEDNGGPRPSGTLFAAQHDDSRLAGEGGWRLDPNNLFEASADGAWRSLRLAALPGNDWGQRQSWGQSLAWEGDTGNGLTQRLQFQAREANLDLPASGGTAAYAYQQSGFGLDYDTEKAWGWLLLDAGANLGSLEQRAAGQARAVDTEGFWFEGHVQPWSGARLGLGASADGASGGAKSFQAGPRLQFEQSLTRTLGLRLDYGTGLALSRLDGPALPTDASASVFESDPLLPSLTARPERQAVDAKLALPWRPLDGLSLEPGAFVREDEDAFLPGQSALPGLWTETTVGTLTLSGGSLDERYQQGSWWQSFRVLGQKAALTGAPGLLPTFIPNWKASFALGWHQGAFAARSGLDVVGARQASLSGGWTLPTQWDWNLHLSYDLNQYWTFFIEGDSLAGAVQDWPLYTEPAPYLGLGVKLRF